jgi:hypothetical protein
MANGGKRPGAGRKSKAALLLDQERVAKNLADWFTPDLQKSVWNKLIKSEDQNVQYKAVSYLSDRLYGKAAQSMKIEGEMEVAIVKRVLSDL